MPDYSHRHPSTQQIMRWFTWDHMIEDLGDSPELVTGLRKLLEAKDCFVRQLVADRDA